VGGSAARSAVDQADAPGAASAQEAGLAADDLLVELEGGLEAAWAQEAGLAVDGFLVNREVGLAAARAAQARSSWGGRGPQWPRRTEFDVSASRH
jgi:hypothetical protein